MLSKYVLSVDGGFNANFTVNGDAGNDTIDVQGDINPYYSPSLSRHPLQVANLPLRSHFLHVTEVQAMGEVQAFFFEPSFNRAVKVRTTDARLTSDAGALLLREADSKLGLTESLAAKLIDPRNGLPRISYLRAHTYKFSAAACQMQFNPLVASGGRPLASGSIETF